MGDEVLNERILTEKLSMLSSSRQSIKSLSKLCISKRNNAKQVVETWERLFRSASREQQVSFLYLANDILQYSRREGDEFLSEFWKIVPATLKEFFDNGDVQCKKVALRLVDIWEERKVFGSRGRNLKKEVLSGKNPSLGKNSSPVDDGNDSDSLMVVKRDGNYLRIKLAVGDLPEKFLNSHQSVHADNVNEEEALSNCANIKTHAQDLGNYVVNASSQGSQPSSDLADNVQQENMRQQYINQLENSESLMVAQIYQLKQVLKEQGSKLELIRNELAVARGQIGKAASMRLSSTPIFSTPPKRNKLTIEESTKATAAAVAAKLASSTSTAQMLTSILSSLNAEESGSLSRSLKKPKLEPFSFTSMNSFEGHGSTYFHSSTINLSPIQANNVPSSSQLNQLQPPLLQPLANSSVSQSMGLP